MLSVWETWTALLQPPDDQTLTPFNAALAISPQPL
jgi:hypothetical protein